MFKLTIITIVKDDFSGLTITMNSVRSELNDIEHLIIDGSKTPLLNKKQRKNVRVYSGVDTGISHAFNKGILLSDGEFILFLNAADYLLPGSGRIIKNILKENSIDIFLFPVLRILTNGESVIYKSRKELLWYFMASPHQGMIIKKDIFSEIGLFPIQKYSMDHFIALKLVSRRPALHFRELLIPISAYPEGGHSSKGGPKPFLYNIVNVLKISPVRAPLAFLFNFYFVFKFFFKK